MLRHGVVFLATPYSCSLEQSAPLDDQTAGGRPDLSSAIRNLLTLATSDHISYW
ncbi:hypothetical protein CA85_45230 [Allorhodopirellula solitaria]|uniref:Uncharacterized protein n=1 Tax=Allorhodopirellula solitaria TaxID=2527987 RepID=A0A5C5X1K7_9BACT|nr:hypothetical protein CA85_45230 [Allorhodopirellula solitaria]